MIQLSRESRLMNNLAADELMQASQSADVGRQVTLHLITLMSLEFSHTSTHATTTRVWLLNLLVSPLRTTIEYKSICILI